jgi:hypothetical protein
MLQFPMAQMQRSLEPSQRPTIRNTCAYRQPFKPEANRVFRASELLGNRFDGLIAGTHKQFLFLFSRPMSPCVVSVAYPFLF